ncbi:MAG: putative peptidoglycan lipid II flippase [Pseudohongiellaceae bacterium]|jgi:putative peptidoglycan lipid II flippase
MSQRADRGFLRSARVVSSLTLVSRVMGLLRDAAMAHVLGAGVVNDALTFAWTVPNAFRRLFGEGALSSAFVPVFTKVLDEHGRARARQVSNQVISGLGLGLLVLSVVLIVLVGMIPEAWLESWVGGAEPGKAQLIASFCQLLLPYLAVICVVAQFMAVLNSLGEFAVPAFAPVILNVIWLLGVIGAAVWGAQSNLEDPREAQGFIIVCTILVAACVQFAWHLPKMAALGVGFRLTRPRLGPELRAVATAMGPMLLGMGAAQLNVMADRSIAIAMLPTGGTTHIYYAMRIQQFPMGLVTMAIVTAVYPMLARLMARDDHRGVAATAGLALRSNLLIALPAAVGLVLLAHPIVTLLFERGQFGPDSSVLTAGALAGYAAGIPFAGTVMLLTRACYATGDVKFPVRVGLSMVLVNVSLDLALVGPLGELGLACATSVTTVFTAIWLMVGVRRRLELLPGERLLTGLLPSLLVVALMGAVVSTVDYGLVAWLGNTRDVAIWRVLAGTVSGLAVFVTLAQRLCPKEWQEVSGVWRKGD